MPNIEGFGRFRKDQPNAGDQPRDGPIGGKGYRIDFQPDPEDPGKVLGTLQMVGDGTEDDTLQLFELLNKYRATIDAGYETSLQDSTGTIRITNSCCIFTTTTGMWKKLVEEIEMRSCNTMNSGDPLPSYHNHELTITAAKGKPAIALENLKILRSHYIKCISWSIRSIDVPGDGNALKRTAKMHFRLGVLEGQEDNFHRAIAKIQRIGRTRGWEVTTCKNH